MKKLLSVLLAASIMVTPLVSRVGFAEETLSKETEKEQSWFQKFLKKQNKVAGYFGNKKFSKIVSEEVEWLCKLIEKDPQFIITTGLQICTIFYLLKIKSMVNWDGVAKEIVKEIRMMNFPESMKPMISGMVDLMNEKLHSHLGKMSKL